MNTFSFILLMLCAVAVLWLIITNFGRLWKIVYGSIIGMLAMAVLNKIGITVGINAVTCLVCGVLGIPGFAMLFLLKVLV